MEERKPIPLNVNMVWNAMLPRITELCADSEWTPRMILEGLQLQESFLYTVGSGDGFVVVRSTFDAKSKRRGLFVLCGYNYGTPREVWEAGLDALARSWGADYIEFWSRRDGFRRIGWTPMETRYRKEVT